MKWVGILYINQNIYFNGRCIASTAAHFYNLYCLKKIQLPTELLVLNTQSSNELAQKIISQLPKKQNVIRYNQFSRFIYVLSNPHHYIRSAIIGLLLGVLMLSIGLKVAQSMQESIQKKSHQFHYIELNVQQILKTLGILCRDQQCINQIMISPRSFIVDVNDSILSVNELDTAFESFSCRVIKGCIRCEGE